MINYWTKTNWCFYENPNLQLQWTLSEANSGGIILQHILQKLLSRAIGHYYKPVISESVWFEHKWDIVWFKLCYWEENNICTNNKLNNSFSVALIIIREITPACGMKTVLVGQWINYPNCMDRNFTISIIYYYSIVKIFSTFAQRVVFWIVLSFEWHEGL